MSIQLFAQLCETMINVDEVSSAMTLLQNHPGASQVIKKLHTSQSLSHNQDFSQVKKISWSDLKNRWPQGWVLITGPKGSGAIRAKNNNYYAMASTGGEPVGFENSKGGNVLDFLAQHLGGKWENFSYWIGTENKYAQGKQQSRKQAAPAPAEMNREQLMKKFRPLWAKSIELAVGDCKGMIQTMIKNDAFEKAQRKLEQLKSLDRAADQMANGDETPEAIKMAISAAIAMAAAHYYPEQTGAIEKPRYGSYGYSTERQEGPAQLIKDLTAGDQKKLGTVLGFFKRSLISG